MRTTIGICVALGLLTAHAVRAGFELPKKVQRMAQFEQVKSTAAASGKPIAIVLTDTETTCPLCRTASLAVMDALDRKTLIVYANARDDWRALPQLVRDAFEKPEAGEYIPKTVVVDAGLTRVIATVPYGKPDALDKSLDKAKKAISKAGGTSAAGTSRSGSRSSFGTVRKTESTTGQQRETISVEVKP